MNSWKSIVEAKPPVDQPVWGWDERSDEIKLCEWDGKETDDVGFPWLIVKGSNKEQYSIVMWCPARVPTLPAKKTRNFISDAVKTLFDKKFAKLQNR